MSKGYHIAAIWRGSHGDELSRREIDVTEVLDEGKAVRNILIDLIKDREHVFYVGDTISIEELS